MLLLLMMIGAALSVLLLLIGTALSLLRGHPTGTVRMLPRAFGHLLGLETSALPLVH
jgi:hypothetical protein